MRVTTEFESKRAQDWQLVRSVAVVTSGLAGAVCAALYGFAGVSPGILVAGTAVTGLAIGCHLPPVRST
jgi:ABC-type uncharacterized transport system permease subunit